MTDDPLAEARRIVEADLSTEVARALRAFRDELAKSAAIDPDEAHTYGEQYLDHLLSVWLPLPQEDE